MLGCLSENPNSGVPDKLTSYGSSSFLPSRPKCWEWELEGCLQNLFRPATRTTPTVHTGPIQRQWELALTEHLLWSLYVSISSCNLQRARRGLRSLWSLCPLDRKGNRGPRPFPGLSIFPMSVCPSRFSLNAPLCAKDLCPLRGCTHIMTKANRSPGSPSRPATS